MLANGTKLLFKIGDDIEFEEAQGLESTPEWGSNREGIEVNDLTKCTITYEYGVATIEEKEYQFHTTEKKLTEESQIARFVAADKGNTTVEFKEVWTDGTTISFKGLVAVNIAAGELNALRTYTLKVAPDAEPEYTWASDTGVSPRP